MRKQRGESSGEFVAIVLLCLVLFAGWALLSFVVCDSKWKFSGMETQWGPFKGCLVKVPSGFWLPEERVRETDLAPRSGEANKVPK